MILQGFFFLGNLHQLEDFLQFRPGDVAVREELRNCRPHREIHVELPLCFLQGKVAATQEGHDSTVV
jgi:hypothetical protein